MIIIDNTCVCVSENNPLDQGGWGQARTAKQQRGREAIWLFPKVFLPAAQDGWGLLPSAPHVELFPLSVTAQ